MSTDRSTIVSAQYPFGSTTKNGIHVLQEPVPEVIELVATAPLVKDFDLTYLGSDILLIQSIFWSIKGTGSVAVGQMKIVHKDQTDIIKNIISTLNELDLTEQGQKLDVGFVLRPGDELSFTRANTYTTQNTNNYVSISCKRCIVETVPLVVS